jgi:Ethanolamine utilization protein EutJ (predicted chaperonin)
VALRLIIPVDYEIVEGRHFFTAARQLGRGLCVAHSELKTAFDEVGRQLEVILSQNHGLEVSNAVPEPRAFDQLRNLPNAEAGSQGKTIQIEWACSILEQPTR